MADYLKKHTDLAKFIPEQLKNKMNTSLMRNLFNRFLTKEETLPLYGLIGKKTNVSDEVRPRLVQSTLERKVNSLLPLMYGKVGSEEYVFSYQDIINKCEILGIDVENMTEWSKAQNFNYAPPIDLDKFVNFLSYRWCAKAVPVTPSIPGNPDLEPEYYAIRKTTALGAVDLSDWATYNYWVHLDDLPGLGLDVNRTLQAKRPILEYASDIELNTTTKNGKPCRPGTAGQVIHTQVKSRFNQVPHFNLYRYDGHHAELVSPIFYYQEDKGYTVDKYLKKRVKTNKSRNFVYAQGLQDKDGESLFYKKASNLHCIWEPGPIVAQSTIPILAGFGNGTCSTPVPVPTAPHETWTLTAKTPLIFSVIGSKSGPMPDATEGVPYNNGIVSFLITAGLSPFQVVDNFTFKVVNSDTTRYVTEDANEDVYDFPGGPAADTNRTGAWLTPPMLFYNAVHENRKETLHGDLTNHFNNIIGEQLALEGSSFGSNNYRNIANDHGLGGRIKDFNGAFNIFLSLLLQRDVSPLSILDFAEKQYAIAVNSLSEYYIQNLLGFLTEEGAIPLNGIDSADSQVKKLLAAYEDYQTGRTDLQVVFGDTTSPIANWPLTLPYMGLIQKVLPKVDFDLELGISVIVHHDGHLSPLGQRDVEFDREITRQKVKRSNNTEVAGIFSTTAPNSGLFKNQLWFNSTNNELSVFNVISEEEAPLTFNTNDYWYIRSSNLLQQYNGAMWVTVPVTAAWTLIETDEILNSLILAAEQKLYDGVHQEQEQFWDITAPSATSSATMEIELAKFAAKYSYDPYGVDYNPTDAFTWNYHLATLPGVLAGTARWYNAYKEHFTGVGLIPTERPNLEPWKLLGNSTKPVGFDATYACPITSINTSITYDVKCLLNVDVPTLDSGGAPNVVDGYTLANNNKVLVINQVNPARNGVYSVITVGTGSNGTWSRAAEFTLSAQFVVDTNVFVLSGFEWKNTHWVLTTPTPVLTLDPITFVLYRLWSELLWTNIGLAHPGLKLCVNTHTDELLPPYVSPTRWDSSQALTTTIPTGISDSYQFGDDGPTENVWKKSLEFNYGALRSGFKLNPINFLDASWGHSYISVNQFKMDKQAAKKLSHKDFTLHGEIRKTSPRVAEDLISGSIAAVNKTVDCTVKYSSTNKTVLDISVDGAASGTYIFEGGMPLTATISGVTFTNFVIDDLGRAFDLDDTLTITFNPAGNASYKFTQGKNKKFNGLNQTYTTLLRYNSVDTKVTFNAIMLRHWDIRLGYRVDGMIKTDDLVVKSDAFTIPPPSFNAVMKTNSLVRNTWLNAIRVQLVQQGSYELNPTDFGEIKIPIDKAADWTFRVENYNPNYPILDYIPLDTAGDYTTFNAMSKAHSSDEWKIYTEALSTKQLTTVPKTIVGLQNVIDFLYGYIKRIDEDGWKFNRDDKPDIDDLTGRNVNWQLEVEKLIDAVYDGLIPGNGIILNPFQSSVWFETPTGLMSDLSHSRFADLLTSQLVFDTLGTAIDSKSLRVIREDNITQITSDIPMYTCHSFVDEYEHVILFDDYLEKETRTGLIYDSFIGMIINHLLLVGQKQLVPSKRPSYGGYYLKDAEVLRNIEASVDDMGRYYDTNHVFENEETTKAALSLLGFNKKQYFTDLGVSDKGQFNFWRGMIHSKGANLTVSAFLNSSKFSDAKIDEYWAYKVAEYGDARTNIYPELKISPSDCLLKNTRLQFFNAGEEAHTGLIPGFQPIDALDDTRWFSIDDLGSHLYFEAEPSGSTTVKVPPVVSNIVSSGSGTISDYSVDYGSPVVGTITVTFTNPTTFNVSGPVFLVGGVVDVPISLSGLNFTVTDGNIPWIAGDTIVFQVQTTGLSTLVTLPFSADRFECSPSVIRTTSNTVTVTQANQVFTVSGWVPAKPKFSPIKLLDYVESTLVEDISVWHPAYGTHETSSLEIINLIADTDQAKYNTTTLVLGNTGYDPLRAWGDREVGRIWWDTSNIGYVPYYDEQIFPNIDERLARWGTLADWSTVDVYEWVKSDVPPIEYDAQAAIEELDVEIPDSIRKSGRAGIKQSYKRVRNWKSRPIAWSYSKIPNDPWIPTFASSFFSKLFLSAASGDITMILDKGRFSDYGVVSGMKLSAWDETIPVGEATVGTTFGYAIGNELDYPESIMSPNVNFSNITVQPSLKTNALGTALGTIVLSNESELGTEYIRATELATGLTQRLAVTAFAGLIGSSLDYDFTDLGILVHAVTAATPLSAITIAQALGNVDHDIVIRQTVSATTELDFPDTVLINDPLDPNYSVSSFGWRAWTTPTNDQLASDLASPNNSWQPVYGEYSYVSSISADLITSVKKYLASPLVLLDGTEVEKYASDWSDWALLSHEVKTVTGTGSSATCTFSEAADNTRLAVYINGLAQLRSSYTISGKNVTVTSVPNGHSLRVIHRKYEPTEDEIKFDPDVSDDPARQSQYKIDYPYVVAPTRDSNDVIVNQYYFWVKDKSIAPTGKSVSIQQAEKLLKSGPSVYLTFHNIQVAAGGLPVRYDSIACAGLNRYVTRDNSYKLRFTRDFILRDDPIDLDLKNTHTEWELIRESQFSKIPQTLWDKLTDAACGQNSFGSKLPSKVRIDYDNRHNTRTRYGFNPDQIFAATDLCVSSIVYSIRNTTLVKTTTQCSNVGEAANAINTPDIILGLNLDTLEDDFSTPEGAREIMDKIWRTAKPKQINEIFFSVLNDALANNYEFTDIFKTSRLSAHSIRTIQPPIVSVFDDYN